MSEEELARRLRAIYDAMCERQEVVITFCLFALVYRRELRNIKNKARVALCRKAGLPDSYAGEIYKGIKLAPYVELKACDKEWLRQLGSVNKSENNKNREMTQNSRDSNSSFSHGLSGYSFRYTLNKGV